ncbi:hypothetical protein ACJX0J_015347 [Zea mays]
MVLRFNQTHSLDYICHLIHFSTADNTLINMGATHELQSSQLVYDTNICWLKPYSKKMNTLIHK